MQRVTHNVKMQVPHQQQSTTADEQQVSDVREPRLGRDQQNNRMPSEIQYENHNVINASALQQSHQHQITSQSDHRQQQNSLAGRGNGHRNTPQFLRKLLTITETASPHAASWSDDGEYFEVHNNKAFEKLLGKHFVNGNVKSFKRQLAYYGFSRRSLDTYGQKWSFWHPKFRQDDIEGVLEIRRSTLKPESYATVSKLNYYKSQLDEVKEKLNWLLDHLGLKEHMIPDKTTRRTRISTTIHNPQQQHRNVSNDLNEQPQDDGIDDMEQQQASGDNAKQILEHDEQEHMHHIDHNGSQRHGQHMEQEALNSTTTLPEVGQQHNELHGDQSTTESEYHLGNHVAEPAVMHETSASGKSVNEYSAHDSQRNSEQHEDPQSHEQGHVGALHSDNVTTDRVESSTRKRIGLDVLDSEFQSIRNDLEINDRSQEQCDETVHQQDSRDTTEHSHQHKRARY